ncbi:ExeA family protein [Aestuariirhabdus litorea]|uniref:AAA family ATPase n=1 Tax=Aestuariirhabdus litorea TaxID=2528527 RepID=A0A3P3VK62_9GAMM|nr:AAA family ATPase [Aestuariirhabdus litorea]RRJ83115.1 AAA family ATPase [Aestuariirhabdus litorea]RWW93271.1 AAA family ATPase [Endozoicomonadaceae bacterium GTF-13]
MYQQFFGLREQPFALTPNTDFMVNLSSHQECMNLLQVALSQGEGFVKIVGEVGTGKTLICRQLMKELDSQGFVVAYLPSPELNGRELLMALAKELGLNNLKLDNPHDLRERIFYRLIELARGNQRVVLLVDEAQSMGRDTLESLRLITNLETEKRKLLQVVLFGQPELDELLQGKEMRQLRQRITFSYRLMPIVQGNIGHYVNHRLTVAGYNGEGLFEPAALKRIYRASSGIPRLVNILCNKSMMAAYGKGDRKIAVRHVSRAIKDTEEAVRQGTGILWLAGGVTLALALLAGVLYRGML